MHLNCKQTIFGVNNSHANKHNNTDVLKKKSHVNRNEWKTLVNLECHFET